MEKIDCKGEHHWNRRAHAEVLFSPGRRIIYDCVDCLAIKVTFIGDKYIGTGKTSEVIVEEPK